MTTGPGYDGELVKPADLLLQYVILQIQRSVQLKSTERKFPKTWKELTVCRNGHPTAGPSPVFPSHKMFTSNQG